MSEVADFIEAQYQRIERVALMAAEKGGPHWPDSNTEMWTNELVHARLHDPAFVLADIESKRRILARHSECGTGSGYCDDGGHDLGDLGCGDLLDLAAPFSGEPGYKEDWTVE